MAFHAPITGGRRRAPSIPAAVIFDTDSDALSIDLKAALIAEIAAARTSADMDALKLKIRSSWDVLPREDYWKVFEAAIGQFFAVHGGERFAHCAVGSM